MPESNPSDAAARHLRQQHKLAKDLIRKAREGDVSSLARFRNVFPDKSEFQLADAQLVIAREAGFESWVKLVKHVEEIERQQFKLAVQQHDAAEVRRLLSGSDYLQTQVNSALFDFGRRAVHAASNHQDLLDVLLEFGADLSLKSQWNAGPYSVLDDASEQSVRYLLSRGAKLTANVAARLGWLHELKELLDRDPANLESVGGDGKRPLHEAKDIEIAVYLLDRGAQIDARCLDHHSTPAQYALIERPEVCRLLIGRGARADLFMAAHLGDLDLAKRLIAEDPHSTAARVNLDGYPAVPKFNIYCWTIGRYVSPLEVARRAGHRDVADWIQAHSSANTRLIDAAWRADRAACEQIIASQPNVLSTLSKHDQSLIAHAAHFFKTDAVKLMLDLGFDPAATSVDGGSTLHQACWVGSVEIVDMLLKDGRSDLNLPDPTHKSRPISWAAYGSVHRREAKGDYVEVIRRLARAGADLQARGNLNDTSLVQMAEGNPSIQALLRDLIAEKTP